MQLTDVFPQIPKVKRLVVTSPDTTGQSVDFGVWFRAFQGLINREEPHLYYLDASDTKHWLDYYVAAFGLLTARLDGVDDIIER